MNLANNKIEIDKSSFTSYYNLSDPSCLNKFAWSTIQMSVGKSMSCHRVDGDDITPENYKNFHNTPSKIKDREQMLNGQWPDSNGPNPIRPHFGCEVCREVEEAGGVSERKMMNNNHYMHHMTPKELKINPKATYTTPSILEIFFNNQCNMACIYCAPKFSSLIAAENYRHGTRTEEVKEVLNYRKDYKQLLAAHFEWMKENAQSLFKYNILGGEPFYQPELEQNFDFFAENPCPDLTVSIFSNLNIEKNIFREKLEKIKKLIETKHLGYVLLFCSFDCWGPQVEYIRYGVNLKKWEENFNMLLKEFPEIEIYVHSTLTAVTFSTFANLCEKIQIWNLTRPVKHTISTVDARPFLYPGIMPVDFYKESINKSIQSYQQIIKQTQNMFYERPRDNEERIALIRHYHETIAILKGYEKTFNNHKFDIDLIKELKTFLDTNDSRRNTNWKLLWPEIEALND